MKILHVIPEFNLAGAQVMAENLLRTLKKDGFEVKAVSLYTIETAITDRLDAAGIEIMYLNKKSGFDVKAVKLLKKIIKEWKPDVIHTHSYTLKYVYIAVKGLKKIRIVHTVHNLASKETTRANLILERILFKKGVVQPVAISPAVKSSIENYYGLEANNVPMIFNGIDLSKCIVKRDYTIENKQVRLIHIGRFQKQKNHLMIVKSMQVLAKKYPKIKLYFYGTGPLENEINQSIIEHGLKEHIVIVGTVSWIYKEMTSSDIFLLPSLWEGMPMTLIEAMASGMPIIVTPVGGIADVITNEYNGLICDTSYLSLANAIEKLIINPVLREKIGKNALETSKVFSAQNMAIEYGKLYKNKD